MLGRKFTIVIDHCALTWLLSLKEHKERLERWIEKLGQFDFENDYQTGTKISHAYSLSTVPAVEDPSYYVEKSQVLVKKHTQKCWSDVFANKKKNFESIRRFLGERIVNVGSETRTDLKREKLLGHQ